MGKARRPWWYVASTPRRAFTFGGLYLLLSAIPLTEIGSGGFLPNWLHLALGLLFIFLSIPRLTCGIMLCRRASVPGSEPLTTPPLDPAGKAEIDSLLTRGKVIPAVRRARQLTGLPLADARKLVDSLRR